MIETKMMSLFQTMQANKLKEYQDDISAAAKTKKRSAANLTDSQHGSEVKRPRLDSASAKQMSLFDPNRRNLANTDDRVMRYIVNEMRPLHTVVKESFREFLDSSVMCRNTLNVGMTEKGANMVVKLRHDVSESPAVCTTADIWSCMHRSYLGVTVHWISDDLTRQSAAVACGRLKGSHTYDVVADNLNAVHNKYGLYTEVLVSNGD